MASSNAFPASFATCSIGTQPEHLLPLKLEAISSAGFTAIELAFPDLQTFASQHFKRDVDAKDYDSLADAATKVKTMCEVMELKVLMLQPFSNFEGWEEGSEQRKDAFERARGWIKIMQSVGTDMLQVGSSDSPSITSSRSQLASDLRELADMLNEHGFRLAYENWCWATHAPTWKDVWEIVKEVDRPNIGLCLDTFQTAGGEWGDPTTTSGLIERDGGREALEAQFRKSLEELTSTVPKDKIFLLQVSDAYKPPQPFDRAPDDSGLRPRGRWSHDFRPVPFGEGYLPVVDVARAVVRTGFQGWFSMEVFDGGPDGKGGYEDDMTVFAKKAMAAHKRLAEECESG
ncbi:MAG: hypothetical protein M1833_006475 [Piccolia ochrophora]|nr:MAG: hypothetical protein M1833_006475 [Piccolia ochrophora]